jgi:hypothetical protein
MKNRLAWLLACFLAAASHTPSLADEVPTGFGSVPYSAEQVIRRGGAEMVQKLFYTPGHLRIESDAGTSFLDEANKRMWVKAPGAHGYMALPYDAASVAGTAPGGTFKSTRVGEETVEGLKTIKYSFEIANGKMTGKGFYWMTPQGIRVKQEGETKFDPSQPAVHFTIFLRNIQFGEQDPSLFKMQK